MKKIIYFISQSKGGAGKSILTFMLAEKYKQAILLDLDDATTTIKQLAYREPVKVTFLDHVTQRIDRGAFNGLFESVINNNEELFIADLGASVEIPPNVTTSFRGKVTTESYVTYCSK